MAKRLKKILTLDQEILGHKNLGEIGSKLLVCPREMYLIKS